MRWAKKVWNSQGDVQVITHVSTFDLLLQLFAYSTLQVYPVGTVRPEKEVSVWSSIVKFEKKIQVKSRTVSCRKPKWGDSEIFNGGKKINC